MNEATVREIEALDEQLFNNQRTQQFQGNASVLQRLDSIFLQLVGDEIINDDHDAARQDVLMLVQSLSNDIDDDVLLEQSSELDPVEESASEATTLGKIVNFFREHSPISVASRYSPVNMSGNH